MLWTVVVLAVTAAVVWLAPEVIVRTNLRDRPLAAAFAGIDGTITSSGAQWGWLGGIEYRDVVLRDRAGRAAVVVPRLLIDRGLVRLALDPGNLGTVRLVEPEALVEVRGDGSSLEDILAAWLAASGRPPAMELEIVDATVEFVDAAREDAWRLSDVIAAGTLERDGTLAGWTAAGRLRHSDGPGGAAGAPAGGAPLPAPGAPVRLDRSTIPAAAAAVLVRDGGWSLSSPAAAGDGMRTVTVAAHRLPLGFSSVFATRFGATHLVDGVADVRLDMTASASGRRLQGDMTLEQFAVCGAERLDERFAIERCAVPFDVVVEDGRLVVQRLVVSSPVFRAEASGGVRLPREDVRTWADDLVSDTFTLAVDVDLAAAARALPAGIAVRPDVRVTGGSLRFAASARADGDDRLLELRASARDLAAVQANASDGAAGRQLAWQEPFTAWLKARRGPARGERLRIEEARLVSKAVEVSAAGSPAAMAIQWTADIGSLVAELSGVLDLGAVVARGRSRGRIDLVDGAPGLTDLKLAATVSDVEVEIPGRRVWRDEEIAFEAESVANVTAGVAAVERARWVMTAGDDRLEANLGGGVLVDLAALAGLGGAGRVPWIRPAATADAVAADAALSGDLATWQPRLWGLVSGPPGVELGGRIKAAVAVTPKADAWLVQRAGMEVEKFTARWEGHEIAEPRVVATAAGTLEAGSGRVDVSSGEFLTATVSLRTGGITWVPARGTPATSADAVRGRLQWQADIARLGPWLVSADVLARWRAAGRAWGTCEIVDAQEGVNMLVEATGSQLVLAAAEAGERRPAWSEPRLALTFEVTRPFASRGGFADELKIDRLGIESSTMALAATGRVDDWSTRGLVSLDGTAAYDWAQVSRLLTPWTGGRLQVVGSGGRPFALRGSLTAPRQEVAVAHDHEPAAQAIPLPDDWLSAARGRDPKDRAVVARVARPASSSSPPLDERLRGLAIDTSAAWTAADIDGFQLSAGEMAVRLLEGQLAFGPFDLPAAGGRLRAAPWVRLAPWPGELIVPPGRVAERVALTGALADRWMRWFSPVLGHATHAAGVASIDLAGARVPLGDPFGGEAAGQVTFENFEVTPAAALQPLATLLVKLQSVVDPRFAFGDKAVLMRVRPDPIRFRLAGRRLVHEGLVMDVGQLTVRSAGTVADDGALAMTVEVALRGDIGGATPVVGQLLRTPLVIPLKGTVHQPQFDARSIDLILGRIVENTAEAVITDGLGRGLDAIFGAGGGRQTEPAPLTLPPQAAPR